MVESKVGKPETANAPPVVPVTAPTGLALGIKVQQLRILRRLTREDLARKTGLSYGTIRNIELGNVFPSITSLKALDSVFGGQVERLEA